MEPEEFDASLASLSSAEDFLGYFKVNFDPEIVASKRIALLRNFHRALEGMPEPRGYLAYKKALNLAYRDLLLGSHLPLASSNCAHCTECDD
ncbi:nitrogenase-stabilizing/protective protein NifW [Vibrio hangzhouensis]|uniref:Nitrogenase-stabilizing/protective protein NifW n=1 Tax=Vibrio hangzhouensis TaxID=462991 RepID=A0A1H5TGQ5_9VIBR|nr:nitrogenase-stabilizing/protective protein NifW [Vibrio hangzhouensis]SEF61930.1 nitrogenase-stabilizing/protective protein [Vibrio hangzhouensis]